MLRMLTTPGLKRELIAEDHVEAVLAFIKFHLSANALAFADGRLCRQYRPDIKATGGQQYRTMHSHCWESKPGPCPSAEHCCMGSYSWHVPEAASCHEILLTERVHLLCDNSKTS